jgi:hypothetical protein
MRTIIIGAVLLGLIGQAEAEDMWSANTIIPGCRSLLAPKPPTPKGDVSGWTEIMQWQFEVGRCVGVVHGVIVGDRDRDICIPFGEVTLGQQVTVVIKYIERHVEDMHLSFGVLAHEALKEAWPGPCKPDQTDK